jgi:two-component system chemotaxis response regulator CheY
MKDDFGHLRVLLVEDVAEYRRYLSLLLGKIGVVDVDGAENGLDALVLLRMRDYDIVFTDWKMPGMTGLELLEAIRADERLRRLPVVMITSETLRDSIIRAAQAGVDDYLAKPVTLDKLAEKLRKHFSGDSISGAA